MDRLRLVWIDHYWSRLVNIGLDGLKYKKVWVNIGKDWLICYNSGWVLPIFNQYLDGIILTNDQLILPNYWLRITKTKYAVVWDSIG